MFLYFLVPLSNVPQIVQLRQQIEQAQREYHTLAGGLKASEQHLAQMQEQLKGQPLRQNLTVLLLLQG